MMKENVKKWLSESDFSDIRGKDNRVLLIDLFKDYVCWCYRNREDIKEFTVQTLSSMLEEIGYEKIQSYRGMYFLIK